MEKTELSGPPKLIIIGGSAGSLQAIFKILAVLDTSFDVPILFIIHRNTGNDSNLQDLMASKTSLIVSEIEEKEAILPGHFYICPADYHVLVESNYSFSLDVSEKVNFSRPSLDVVFQSAAPIFKQQLTAILLSGANADGAEGLFSIHAAGGTTIVQDPLDAQVGHMPEQALKLFNPDYVLKAEEIGPFLNFLFVDKKY